MNVDTKISQIDRTYGAYLATAKQPARLMLHRTCDKAKSKALYDFARLNGWWATKNGACHPDAIGRRSHQWLHSEHDLGLPSGPFGHFFDHCVTFRASGKNSAVLAQPYNHIDVDACRAWFADRGLVLHVPPDPLASIHYPGETLFVVVTRISETVKWLPDQHGRLAGRWAARREAA